MKMSDYVTAINRDFLIRYRFNDVSKKTALIGAGRYTLILEKTRNPEAMALQHFERVLNSKKDGNQTIKLRGGLIVTFIQRK